MLDGSEPSGDERSITDSDRGEDDKSRALINVEGLAPEEDAAELTLLFTWFCDDASEDLLGAVDLVFDRVSRDTVDD